MEEQLISFETAKLAKEKGFYFTSNNEGYNGNGEIVEIGVNNGEIIFFDRDITAATQSLLQKWLREVNNIVVECVFDETQLDTFEYLLFIYKDRTDIIIEGHEIFGNYWDTYEEALEIGLQEALKLIKK